MSSIPLFITTFQKKRSKKLGNNLSNGFSLHSLPVYPKFFSFKQNQINVIYSSFHQSSSEEENKRLDKRLNRCFFGDFNTSITKEIYKTKIFPYKQNQINVFYSSFYHNISEKEYKKLDKSLSNGFSVNSLPPYPKNAIWLSKK